GGAPDPPRPPVVHAGRGGPPVDRLPRVLRALPRAPRAHADPRRPALGAPARAPRRRPARPREPPPAGPDPPQPRPRDAHPPPRPGPAALRRSSDRGPGTRPERPTGEPAGPPRQAPPDDRRAALAPGGHRVGGLRRADELRRRGHGREGIARRSLPRRDRRPARVGPRREHRPLQPDRGGPRPGGRRVRHRP